MPTPAETIAALQTELRALRVLVAEQDLRQLALAAEIELLKLETSRLAAWQAQRTERKR